MASALTGRQRTVLEEIADLARTGGSPPSIRELATRLGTTPKSALGHLRALERKGVLTRLPRVARGIRISGAAGIRSQMAQEPGVWNARPISVLERVPQGIAVRARTAGELARFATGRLSIDFGLFPEPEIVAIAMKTESQTAKNLVEGAHILVSLAGRSPSNDHGIIVRRDGSFAQVEGSYAAIPSGCVSFPGAVIGVIHRY